MSEFPCRADRHDPIGREARKLIDDSARAAIRSSVPLTDFARHLLAERRERNRFFDPLLFANPVWDLLLHLYVADGEARSLPMADCPSLVGLSPSVALRWFAFLKQEDMIAETVELSRAGQACVRLTEQTCRAITAYLRSLAAMGAGHRLPSCHPDRPSAPGTAGQTRPVC